MSDQNNSHYMFSPEESEGLCFREISRDELIVPIAPDPDPLKINQMKLYCQQCGENHEFDVLEVERIVYGLQAELAESLVNDDATNVYYEQFKGKNCYDAMRCLKDHESMAGDCEGYGEHTRALRDARREIDGLNGCDYCNADTPNELYCDKCAAES